MLRKKENRKEKIIRESLPPLEEGINLVRKPGKAPVLQTFVARELAGKNANAVWADIGNESSTYELAARDEELLEKVFIGRSFTPFQHHELVHELEKYVDEETELLIAPNFTSLYTEGQVSEREALELFYESWTEIKRLVEDHSLKLLVTVEGSSEMCFKVELDADRLVEAEKTVKGWKYSSRDFDTRAYREDTGVQTTMNYWKEFERSYAEVTN